MYRVGYTSYMHEGQEEGAIFSKQESAFLMEDEDPHIAV